MITRRALLGGAAGLAAGATVPWLSSCSVPRADDRISLWGVAGNQRQVQQKVIDSFLKLNPGLTIDAKNVPTNGQAGDATSVITAVRGRTAPDLWWMDRFTGAQYAAIGLLEPIDDLIAKYESADFLDAWLPFATNELTYKGKHYGLPTYTDARGMFYNKTLLRNAGVDLDEFDMANGPMTLQRVFDIAESVTQTDKRGNYTQLGFVPWHLQGSGFTWSVGTGSTYFDSSQCEMTLASEPIIRAHQMMYDYARAHNFPRIDAFIQSYEPLNAPPGQTAFAGGKLAMDLSQSSSSRLITKYAPDLDFGYTHLPVFEKGDQPYTWSGGFSVVMPKGSSMSRQAWEFLKYYAGPAGQAIMCPATKTLPTRRDVFDTPGVRERQDVINQLKYSTSRPPVPVGALWWNAMLNVQSSITVGSATPRQALTEAQARVNSQMPTYCPFSLPANYGKTGF